MINYCKNCSGVHFDYDAVEVPNSFNEPSYDVEELKCSQNLISRSLRASVQENISTNTLNTDKVLTKRKSLNSKSTKPRILIYK